MGDLFKRFSSYFADEILNGYFLFLVSICVLLGGLNFILCFVLFYSFLLLFFIANLLKNNLHRKKISKLTVKYSSILLLVFLLSFFYSMNYEKIPEGPFNLVGKVSRYNAGTLKITDVLFLRDKTWNKSKDTLYTYSYLPDSYMLPGMKISLFGKVEDNGGFKSIVPESPRDISSFEYGNSLFDHLFLAVQKFTVENTYFLKENLSAKNASLASSLLFGRNLDTEVKRDIRNSGLSYFFVISGMHFFIVFFVFDLILNLLIKNYFLKNSFLILFMTFYLFISGFSASSLRAFTFIFLYLLTKYTDYPIKKLNILAIAFLIQISFDFQKIYDISLYLSYSATMGIIIFSRYKFFRNDFFNSTLVIMGGILFSLPVSAYFFHTIPFTSLLFGLFISTPMIFVLMPSLLFTVIFFLLNLKIISIYILMGISPLLTAMENIIKFFSGNFGILNIGEKGIFFEILLIFFIVFTLEIKYHRLRLNKQKV